MKINFQTKNVSPILILAYKRYDMLEDLLVLLPLNRKVYIHIDGPDDKTRSDVEKTRNVALNYKNNCIGNQVQITSQEHNLGNIKSFKAAMAWVFVYEQQIIFLEEDIRFNVNFFSFMDWALESFHNENRIFQINGLSVLDIFPTRNRLFETYSCKPWGFGTWKDRWDIYTRTSIPSNSEEIFQAPVFNGVNLTETFRSKWIDRFDRLKLGNDTYDLGWNYAAWANSSYAISLRRTLTTNIGFDSRSLHTKLRPKFLRSQIALHNRRFGRKDLKLISFPSYFDSYSDFIEWKVPGLNHRSLSFFVLIYAFLVRIKSFNKEIINKF
jgi:hypothetical protein